MILSSSGGIVYHARAAFSFPSWIETRRSVSTCVQHWLAEIQPQHLIIFGPSGGYLLERDVFQSARRATLTVVDPDPIAEQVFRRRIELSAMTWLTRSDLLPFTSANPKAFLNFVSDQKRFGKVAVLFFGMLGQIDLHRADFKREKTEGTSILRDDLKSLAVPWASLHDLESTVLTSRLTPELAREVMREIFALAPSATARAELRVRAVQEILQKAQMTGDRSWIDHETEWLGTPQSVIPWPLTRRRLHLLGWTSFVGTD